MLKDSLQILSILGIDLITEGKKEINRISDCDNYITYIYDWKIEAKYVLCKV